ncbi:MAG TPA: hypothetical protein PKO22_10075 [Treponemataceae bacterium]|nr:hypothetical protein [Treponemataceae bacterium]
MKRFALGLLAFTLFSLSALPLAAQTSVPGEISSRADAAFAGKSAAGLESVLKSSVGKPWYPRLEAYVMKRVRQSVIDNELEFARDASRAVIEVNLDNAEAVEMYQSIQGGIARRDEANRLAAEREALLDFRQKQAEEKARQEIAKDYKTVTNTLSGKKVYLEQNLNASYRPLDWDISLGLANIGVLLDRDTEAKYGLSFGANFLYRGDVAFGGVELDAGAMLVTFTGSQSTSWSSTLSGIVGLTRLNRSLVARAGFALFGYRYGAEGLSASLFASPSVGIGARDARFGDRLLVSACVDYYPGHLWTPGMLAAAGAKAEAAFIVADMDDFDILFRAAVRDTVFMRDAGALNDLRISFSIGVGDYE